MIDFVQFAQLLSINIVVIHLVCRVVAFFKRPVLYDENPYLMKLAKHQNIDADEKQESQHEERKAARREQIKEKKKGSRARSESPISVRSRKPIAVVTGKPIVVVTGSSGRIGSSVVKALLEEGTYAIRGLDRHEPVGLRKYEGIDYRTIDIVQASDTQILEALQNVVGIIHCAGTLKLYDAPAEVHNDITFTTVRLMWLARKSGCIAFVHTGCTTVINNGLLNVNAIPPDRPYEEIQTSDWGRAHVKTEKFVLSASDDPEHENSTFFTCVNRFPGLYGLNDKLVVSVMIEGELSVFPSRTDVRVEMLYLKNAAHAHICALKSLLDTSARIGAAGRAQVITQSVEGETGTNLEFWTRGRSILGIRRPFVILPTWCFYVVAAVFEFIYFYLAGMVPKSIFWNFTRQFVRAIVHDNTFLGQVEAFRAIGYKPRFTNQSSFEDMARDLREISEIESSSTNRKLLVQLEHDPKDDIDWEPREMPTDPNLVRLLFLTLIGPGVSWHEVILFWFSQVASWTFAYTIALKNSFTLTQTIVAILLAGWHIPGAIISIGPTNKRWFHLGGNLGVFLTIVIFLDLCFSVLIVALFFPENMTEEINWKWMVIGGGSLIFALIMVIFLVPLAHQRSYSVILFFFMIGLQYFQYIPLMKGLEWILPVMAMKFLISHGPRHEPYKF